MSYLQFSLIMLAAQFSPGPDMLLLLKAAVNHPLRAGLFIVLGIVSGLSIHCAVAALGLSAILQTNSWAFSLLRILGGLYLLWLGTQLLLSLRAVQRPAEAADLCLQGNGGISDKAAFLQGFLTNITNVKAIIFLTGFLTAGLHGDASAWRCWLLVGIILGQALVLWSLFLWLLKRPSVLPMYQNLERPLNGIFGALLMGLALQMLRAGVAGL